MKWRNPFPNFNCGNRSDWDEIRYSHNLLGMWFNIHADIYVDPYQVILYSLLVLYITDTVVSCCYTHLRLASLVIVDAALRTLVGVSVVGSCRRSTLFICKYLNPSDAEFIWGNTEIYLNFPPLLKTERARVFEILPRKAQIMFNLHGKCYGYCRTVDIVLVLVSRCQYQKVKRGKTAYSFLWNSVFNSPYLTNTNEISIGRT